MSRSNIIGDSIFGLIEPAQLPETYMIIGTILQERNAQTLALGGYDAVESLPEEQFNRRLVSLLT